MKKVIGTLLLKILGWKIIMEGDLKNLDRCILITAPHTSNWDYFLGVMSYWKLGKKLKAIIKNSHTNSIYGFIINKIGAIGIDRSQKNDLVKIVANLFEKEDFSLVITPEGSRSYAEKWRLGFYYMALEAKIPIVFATGDYKEKVIKLGKMIPYKELLNRPLEDVLDEIENYYKSVHAKYPNQYNPKIY